MPILVILGIILFVYCYVKFKSFRSFTNETIKKTPENLKNHVAREQERQNRNKNR